MKFNVLASLAAIALVGSCTAPEPAPEASLDLDAERVALRAAADAYHAVGEAADFESARTFYPSDARIYPPNAPEESGTAGVNRFIETFSSIPGLELSFGEPIVEVGPEGGMGFTITPTMLRFEGPDGEMVEDSVRDLHIWRRDADGAWKVVVDMWNSGAEP